MNTNHYTEIGADHKVCQDYAASGAIVNVEHGPTFYAIVCDGCSSALHTEFGAQVLTHAAISELKRNPYKIPEDFLRELMYSAKKSVEELKVDPRCLLATLLVVRADDKDTGVWVWGDGVFHVQYKSGHTRTTEIHYESNAPYYPYYATTVRERDAYLSAFGLAKHVYHMDNDGSIGEEHYTGNAAMNASTLWLRTEDVMSVTLMTDGVSSFQDEFKKEISTRQIVDEVTAFKTTAGQYVERRMKAFKRRWSSLSWSHYDDVGVAGISI